MSLSVSLSLSTLSPFGVGRALLLVKKFEVLVANNREELGLERRPPDPLDIKRNVFSLYHMVSRINKRILILFVFINLTKVDLALCKNI